MVGGGGGVRYQGHANGYTDTHVVMPPDIPWAGGATVAAAGAPPFAAPPAVVSVFAKATGAGSAGASGAALTTGGGGISPGSASGTWIASISLNVSAGTPIGGIKRQAAR